MISDERSPLWRRTLFLSFLSAVLAAAYVGLHDRPHTFHDYARRFSDTLFQLSIFYLLIGTVYTLRIIGWRRREGLPRVFAFRHPGEGSSPASEWMEEQPEKREEKDHQEAAAGEKRDKTLLVSGLLLLILSLLAAFA
jgi:hypothetical protein